MSNVVLNDLDWWIAGQWETFESRTTYSHTPDKYRTLRESSKLKQMFIVRYADDFKIFTKDHKQAIKIYHAVKGFLENQLKLDISNEKSDITNLRKRSSEFLGFELRAVRKKNKFVANTHVSRKRKRTITLKLRDLIRKIQKILLKNQSMISMILFLESIIITRAPLKWLMILRISNQKFFVVWEID